VTLTVPLVMTRQWLTTEESRMGANATVATGADAKRLVAYSTGQAYLAVYAQKLVIEVDERARDTARSHAAYAHQRYAGGVGNSIDEVRAIQEAATDDALVQQAYALLTSDEEALGILVGGEGPLDTADEPTLAEPPTLPQGLDRAAGRPDVVALDLRSLAARKTVEDDWSDYAPYLVGVAQPFYQNPRDAHASAWRLRAELLLTVPLYDGGLRYGQHRERAALRDEAKVAYEAGLRQARSDIRTAFEAMRRADEALRSSRGRGEVCESGARSREPGLPRRSHDEHRSDRRRTPGPRRRDTGRDGRRRFSSGALDDAHGDQPIPGAHVGHQRETSMWIVRLALRRPYTFVVVAMLIVVAGVYSILQMPTDILPEIDIPVIAVVWQYNGLPPVEMSSASPATSSAPSPRRRTASSTSRASRSTACRSSRSSSNRARRSRWPTRRSRRSPRRC